MSQIFHEESFLMRGLSRLTDLVILNIFWVLCSLPVVTIGAAACLWLTLSFPAAFPFWMFLGYALVAFLLTKRYLPIVKKLEPSQEQQQGV